MKQEAEITNLSNLNIPSEFFFSDVLTGQLSNGEKIYFESHAIAEDNDCGFHALGLDRNKAITQLLAHAKDENIRHLIAPEIQAAFLEVTLPKEMQDKAYQHLRQVYDAAWESYRQVITEVKEKIHNHNESHAVSIQSFTPDELITWLDSQSKYATLKEQLIKVRLDIVFPVERQLEVYSEKEATFVAFIQHYLGKGGWLTYIGNYQNKTQQTSSLDALAELNRIQVFIWQAHSSNSQQLQLVHQFGKLEYPTIHMLHTHGMTHYDLLQKVESSALTINFSSPIPLGKQEEDLLASSLMSSLDLDNNKHLLVSSEEKQDSIQLPLQVKKIIEEIKQAQEKVDYALQAESFIKLGNYYLGQHEYLYAAAIYNYVLNIYRLRLAKHEEDKKENNKTEQARPSFQKEQQTIIEKLIEIENQFIIELNIPPQKSSIDNPHFYLKSNAEHRNDLKRLRAECKQRLAEIDSQYPFDIYDEEKAKGQEDKYQQLQLEKAELIHNLYHDIAERLKAFIRQLIQECIEVLGSPPCAYAMLGLGSLAREEATPYSDLEFAILIAEEKEDYKQYFRNLTKLLHLKVINLGETILPAMAILALNNYYSNNPLDNWFYDDVTPRGFAFDGAMPQACKTPLGKKDKESHTVYELIHTPEEMAKFLDKGNAVKKYEFESELSLTMILISTCYIGGQQSLVKNYQQLVGTILKQPLTATMLRCQAWAIFFMRKDISEFRVDLGNEDVMGKLYDVKKEIYRFPDRILERLSIYHGIDIANAWERIDIMLKNSYINSTTACNFHILNNITTELRLRCYLANNKQQEIMSSFIFTSEYFNEGIEQDKEILKEFYIPDERILFRLYFSTIPLYKTIGRFLEEKNLDNIYFYHESFFDNSSKNKALIYMRLLNYQKAKNHFTTWLLTNVEDLEGLNYLALLLSKLGDYEKAQTLCRLMLKILGKRPHLKFEHLYWQMQVGNIYYYLAKYEDAISYYEQVLSIKKELVNEQDLDKVYFDEPNVLANLANAYRALGKYQDAIYWYETGLVKLDELSSTQSQSKQLKAMYLNGEGEVYNELAQYRKAFNYHMQALALQKDLYGEQPNPDIASTLNSLGLNFAALGVKTHAISCYKQAISTYKSIFGEKLHPDAVACFANLGNAYSTLQLHKQAIGALKTALSLHKRYFKDNHPQIAGIYTGLGNIYIKQSKYEKAAYYYDEAIKLQEIVYKGQIHPDMVISLFNKGNVFYQTKNYKQAASLYEKALNIQKKIYNNLVHQGMLEVLYQLTKTYYKLNESKKAFECYEFANAIYAKLTVEDSKLIKPLMVEFTELIKENTQQIVARHSTVSSNEVNPYLSRKGLSDKKNLGNQQFAKALPKEKAWGFGKSVDNNDCFYDAIAQALNCMNSGDYYTVKSLRKLCSDHIQQLDQTFPKNNWVKTAIEQDKGIDDYEAHLATLQYTQEEMEKFKKESNVFTGYAIWGKPHIEGHILAKELKIAFHLIEFHETTNSTETLLPIHVLVTESYVKQVDETSINYQDSQTIHIAVYRNHFVPVLPNQYLLKDSKQEVIQFSNHSLIKQKESKENTPFALFNSSISSSSNTNNNYLFNEYFYSRLDTKDLSANSELSYEELLGQADEAKQLGEKQKEQLLIAEKQYAKALQKAVLANRYEQQADCLKSLGDIYLNKKEYIQASALYNAARIRCEKADYSYKDKILHQEVLIHRIKYTEKLLLEEALHRPVKADEISLWIMDEQHKKDLEVLRQGCKQTLAEIDQAYPLEQIYEYGEEENKEKEVKLHELQLARAEQIRNLYHYVTEAIKKLIRQMLEECQTVLGNPPCEYAIMGLGSLAREEMTPYSDFEFAVLIAEEKEEYKQYFRNLTKLLHLKVINIGETILPAMAIPALNNYYSKDPLDNWFYDDITPRGFALDGAMPQACKTPLGKKDKEGNTVYELIHTPEEMVKFLDKKSDDLESRYWFDHEPHLSMILITSTLIQGSENLIRSYVNKVWQALHSIDIQEQMPLHQVWALQLLKGEGFEQFLLGEQNISHHRVKVKGDIQEFKVNPESEEEEGKLYDVKKEIYRFPDRVLERLAIYFGIRSNSAENRIGELYQAGYIHSLAGEHLKITVSITTELRLRAYLMQGSQQESMAIYDVTPKADEIVLKYLQPFQIPNFNQLFRFYFTALPLYQAVINFASLTLSELHDDSNRQKIFKEEIFFDRNLTRYAQVHKRLLQYDKAKKCLKIWLHDHPDDTKSLDTLGSIYYKLGQADKAASSYRKALNIRKNTYKGGLHPSVITSLNNLGVAWKALGYYEKAIKYYKQALFLQQQIYDNKPNSLSIALFINLGVCYKHCEQYEEAINCYKQTLILQKQIYGDKPFLEIASSLNNLAVAVRSLGNYEEAIQWQEQALAIQKQIYGITPHPVIADSLTNLSVFCRALGQYQKAVSYQEQALVMQKQIYANKPHLDIANSLANLGVISSSQGSYEEAIHYQEQALSIRKQIYGENPHPDVAISLNNLGVVYYALGSFEMALYHHQQALTMRKQLYVTTVHSELAASFNNLGNVYHSLKQYEKAIYYHQQALAVRKQLYGEKCHPAVAESLSYLGNIYHSLKSYEKARDYQEQALSMRKQLYGEKAHPETAASLSSIGIIFHSLKQYEKATSYHNQALTMQQQVYGEKPHLGIATTLFNLGLTFRALGFYKEALHYHEQALTMQKKIYRGKPNAEIVDSFNNLGVVYQSLGSYKEAISYHSQALAMQKELYGERIHAELAISFTHLGATYGALGSYEEAIYYQEQALEIQKQIYGGKSDSKVAISLTNLAAAYGALGYYEKAIDFQKQALEIQNQLYGARSNRKVIASLTNLGNIYQFLGQYDESIDYYEKALAFQKQLYNANSHLDIADSLNNLGVTYRELGRYKEAIDYHEKALTMQKQILLTQQHPDLARSLLNLGVAYASSGNFQFATSLIEQSLSIYENTLGNKHADTKIAKDNLIRCYLHLGNQLLLNEETEKAKAFYQIIDADPTDVNLHKSLLTHYYQKNQLLPVIEHAQIISKLTPLDPSAYHNLGCFYHIESQLFKKDRDEINYREKLQKAENTFLKALSLLKEKPYSSINAEFGNFLYQNDRYEEALVYLLKAIALKADNKGLSYGKMEKPTVTDEFKKEIDFRGEIQLKAFVLAYHLLVTTHKKLGQITEAEKVAGEFAQVAANEKECLTFMLLGHAYKELNQLEQAKAAYQNAIQYYQPTAKHPIYALAEKCLQNCQQELNEVKQEVSSKTEINLTKKDDEELSAAIALSLNIPMKEEVSTNYSSATLLAQHSGVYGSRHQVSQTTSQNTAAVEEQALNSLAEEEDLELEAAIKLSLGNK